MTYYQYSRRPAPRPVSRATSARVGRAWEARRLNAESYAALIERAQSGDLAALAETPALLCEDFACERPDQHDAH